MIIAIGSGRAGNLMFQLGGITAMARNNRERLVLVGYHSLAQFFPSLGHHAMLLAVPEKHLETMTLFKRVLLWLAAWRILGSISELSPDASGLVRTRGLVPIAIAIDTYFQDERSISTSLLDSLYADGCASLSLPKVAALRDESKTVCFVHIRRSDYLAFPSTQYPAGLPADWFRKQISLVAAQQPGIIFHFYTDDQEWVAEELSGITNSKIIDASAVEAFYSMANCDAGILSPSTFSWWAAYFAAKKSKGPFIAPKFWTGWRRGKWNPNEKIKASFLTYVEVDPSV